MLYLHWFGFVCCQFLCVFVIVGFYIEGRTTQIPVHYSHRYLAHAQRKKGRLKRSVTVVAATTTTTSTLAGLWCRTANSKLP
jgi:hypothetical protein